MIRGCTCSVNTRWPAQWQAWKCFAGFLEGQGSGWWGLERVQIQRSPHLGDLWVYLTSLKNAQAPGLLSYQFRDLWFIPWNPNYNTQGLLCAKYICHCLNLLAGVVYSIQTGLMVCSSNAKIITQKLSQRGKCSSPAFPSELSAQSGEQVISLPSSYANSSEPQPW